MFTIYIWPWITRWMRQFRSNYLLDFKCSSSRYLTLKLLFYPWLDLRTLFVLIKFYIYRLLEINVTRVLQFLTDWMLKTALLVSHLSLMPKNSGISIWHFLHFFGFFMFVSYLFGSLAMFYGSLLFYLSYKAKAQT